MHSPASRTFSTAWIAFALPTYSGSFLDRVNSASPRGFDLYDEVSPDGISSSVVVTGSCITDATLRRRLSVRGTISGQSLMFGPNLISTEGSAFPTPL